MDFDRFDLKTEEGRAGFRKSVEEFNQRSRTWCDEWNSFERYVKDSVAKLAQGPEYLGKLFVAIRTQSGYAGFVTDREGYWCSGIGRKLYERDKNLPNNMQTKTRMITESERPILFGGMKI